MKMMRSIMSVTCLSLGIVGLVRADEPDWGSMTYTTHSDFQAVDADGFGTFPVDTGDPVKMRGVILNRSEEMLNPTPGAPGFLGGMWQVYVQTVDEEDFGGTACWMGQYIGKIVGNHPAGSYTDAEWLAELDRLTHDPTSEHEFQPGDLVEIRARAPGLHFKGKTNINEQHSNNPEADFDIYLLEADYGLPRPTVLTLSDLKDASDEFIFDQYREIGPEHHQGTLVRINDIEFVDTNGWGPDGELVIQDGTGRTFPVKLGLGDGFSTFGPPTASFDIIGVLDQEDTDTGDGLKDGYRLWVVKNYNGNDRIIPEPFPTGDFDFDNDVDLDDYASFHDCMGGPDTAPPVTPDDCKDVFDFDRDEDVDLIDFAAFVRTFDIP